MHGRWMEMAQVGRLNIEDGQGEKLAMLASFGESAYVKVLILFLYSKMVKMANRPVSVRPRDAPGSARLCDAA
jgi:hypothetical protein